MRALSRADRLAPAAFLLPAVLVVLTMSIFPLIVSLYLSLTRFRLGKGGFNFDFIGLANYRKLLFGSQQFHFLGTLRPLKRMLLRYEYAYMGEGRNVERSVARHREIIEALEQRDRETAAFLVEMNFREALPGLIEQVQALSQPG